jgi:hypothetical protein
VGISDPEKEGIRGVAKTIQALDLLLVINTRDALGAPIDVNLEPTAPPAPAVTKAEVFARIVQLLDEGSTHLQAAGETFSFGLSAGFAGFDTPATFLRFNRALRARVAVYLGDYAGALTALGLSFLDAAAPLTLGVYHIYTTGSGDLVNTLFDPTGRALHAHPSIQAEAQLRADGTPDLRYQNKVTTTAPITVQGITTDQLFTIYNTNVDPIPIIKNEELILLRAEANIGLNDLAAAVTDIDLIRTTSGGLPPYAGAVTQEALLDELLYNKRYSLLFEGGHRWIDLRRYGRLGTDLPLALATHKRFDKFPYPLNECLARSNQPAEACTTQAGF